MRRKQVMVDKQVWDKLAAAAEAQMEQDPGLRKRWLARVCDLDLPDLIPDDHSWPLSFYVWMKTQGAGVVPNNETHWLLERNTSPPQYISSSSSGWNPDVWMARRFVTEREAHDYWRMMGEPDRKQFKVIEHTFVNKP